MIDAQIVIAAERAPVIAVCTPEEKNGSTKSGQIDQCSLIEKNKKPTSCVPNDAEVFARIASCKVTIVCGALNTTRNQHSLIPYELAHARDVFQLIHIMFSE